MLLYRCVLSGVHKDTESLIHLSVTMSGVLLSLVTDHQTDHTPVISTSVSPHVTSMILVCISPACTERPGFDGL